MPPQHCRPYFGGTNARTSLGGAGDVMDVGTEPPHIRLREVCPWLWVGERGDGGGGLGVWACDGDVMGSGVSLTRLRFPPPPPPLCGLLQHSEMAYVDRWPGLIIFGCLLPPESAHAQGQTSLVHTAELASHLPPTFLERLAKEGLQHRLRYSDATTPEGEGESTVKSWQAALSVSCRAEAEQVCAARGWATDWSEAGGTLTISYTRPAYAQHSSGGDSVLFTTDLSTQWYDGWEPYCTLPDAERPYSFGWGGGVRCAFPDKNITLEDAIGSHTCSLEALACM
jgi:hypothetical protein